jgi:aarF domain-containing kinase
MADYRRVLLGARMVLEIAVKRMNPELRSRIERNFTHFADILAVLHDMSRTISNEMKNPQESTINSNPPPFTGTTSTASDFSVSPNTTMREAEFTPKAPPLPKKPIVIDKLGFKSISTEEVQAAQQERDRQQTQQQQLNEKMRERKVPASQFSRVLGFGSLAARLILTEAVSQFSGGSNSSSSNNSSKRGLSEKSAEQLAEALCRMRGAALKLGQMLALQDEQTLSPALAAALDRVKAGADYMPKKQLNQQLEQAWESSSPSTTTESTSGQTRVYTSWRDRFLRFDDHPIAAASIGQVHRASILRTINNHNKDSNNREEVVEVACKVQYPGVAQAITSDLNNLSTLITVLNVVPPGLFLENIIRVAAVELTEECDYIREAEMQTRYRSRVISDPELKDNVYVPEVISELTRPHVLVTEFVRGHPIDQAVNYPASIRNAIARLVLVLTIRELFAWNTVQSDPNYANYLYDPEQSRLNLVDFGATRIYSKVFVDDYLRLVWAAANRDRDTILSISKKLGFLTGDESPAFIDAHVQAGFILGEPFLAASSKSDNPRQTRLDSEEIPEFDFSNSTLTQRISQYGSVFMQHRLTPPPTEAYSLHRKLAGAIMLCIKLKAKIRCRDILKETYQNYVFEEDVAMAGTTTNRKTN